MCYKKGFKDNLLLLATIDLYNLFGGNIINIVNFLFLIKHVVILYKLPHCYDIVI